ncbi:MAG: hypothetical protein SFY32_05695 [Bacteroidota bacterium]|nr:hypothetical protein [Bacteroidota bacterium]
MKKKETVLKFKAIDPAIKEFLECVSKKELLKMKKYWLISVGKSTGNRSMFLIWPKEKVDSFHIYAYNYATVFKGEEKPYPDTCTFNRVSNALISYIFVGYRSAGKKTFPLLLNLPKFLNKNQSTFDPYYISVSEYCKSNELYSFRFINGENQSVDKCIIDLFYLFNM